MTDYYNKYLDCSKVKPLKLRATTSWNYSYYPVIFNSETQLLKVEKALNEYKIYPRRYFYPSLNTIEYATGASMPISEAIASGVMCLPLYVGLDKNTIKKVAEIVNILAQ